MTSKRILRKSVKIASIFLGVILLLLIGFHFWFKAHARQLLEELVEARSNGKLKLKMEKFHFSYFSRNIELEKAVFYNTDTVTGATAYRFSVDKIKLRAKAILPILFKQQILIDSLNLLQPHIQVTRLRAAEKTDKTEKKDVSIPEEMGKVYTSIQDALKVLSVKRFQIDNGTFTLINKILPGQLPVTISNLHLHIDNLQVDTAKLTGNEKLLFSDNIVLRTHDQDILLPDSRHRISFNKFRINIRKRVVEFDSCTIAATRTDGASSSFNVFFDVLQLTDIDFDTLYRSEVIKADSVFCLNPRFTLEVESGKKGNKNKPAPKLESIVQQLTGDLLLNHVVVQNAGFNIKTVRDGVPSTFTFSNNNFEMEGLSIDQGAKKPVRVERFAMAIRNYENFIKDSSYNIKFDSILFKEDRITLSNFLFTKLNNKQVVNSFSIPYFYLGGLSWDDLVFEKRLKADQATMFNPVISYTAPASKKTQSIFNSLGAVNEFMDLQYLDIVDGKIDLDLRNDIHVNLDKATLSVRSHSLFTSKKIAGIKNSLSSIDFENGVIRTGNLVMKLRDIRYAGDTKKLSAGDIDIKNKTRNLDFIMQEVAIDSFQTDEINSSIYAEGVKWQKADLNLTTNNKGEKTAGGLIHLRNVTGLNTNVSGTFNGNMINTWLQQLSFQQLKSYPGENLLLTGLAMQGKELSVKSNTALLKTGDYYLLDNKPSAFRQVTYEMNDPAVTADIKIPALTVTPHVQPLLNGDLVADDINLPKPVIYLTVKNSPAQAEEKNNKGKIHFNDINILQPEIHFMQLRDSVVTRFDWIGTSNSSNRLYAANLQLTNKMLTAKKLDFSIADFSFTDTKGKKINTGQGKIKGRLAALNYTMEEDKQPVWNAVITKLEADDFKFDSLGRSQASLAIQRAELDNFAVSSSSVTSLQKLALNNAAFGLQKFTGSYRSANNSFRWYNTGYDRKTKNLTADSLSLMPLLTRDSFLAKQKFQTDYITLNCGFLKAGAVDLDKLIDENKLVTGTVSVDSFVFTDYKDKQLPFNAGVIKPLPVNLLKKIPQLFSADTIQFTNSAVTYTETGEKTKEPGTIPVTRMLVRLINVKNYNISPNDSLLIQANGYIMDNIWTRLRVRESYTDTAGGFMMTARMKKADLRILNTVLIPLASLKIESGELDTLSMRAVGREYLSLGEMNMVYRNLKVRLMKNSKEEKRGFFNGIVNFIANNFVLRKNNTSKTGKVFYVRDRERSAINYLIKITLSGISSSVGAKGNRKIMRQYKRELEKRNLPPIDFDPAD